MLHDWLGALPFLVISVPGFDRCMDHLLLLEFIVLCLQVDDEIKESHPHVDDVFRLPEVFLLDEAVLC